MQYVESVTQKNQSLVARLSSIPTCFMSRLFALQVGAALTGYAASLLPEGREVLEQLAQPSAGHPIFFAGVVATGLHLAADVIRMVKGGTPQNKAVFSPIQQTLYLASFVPMIEGRSVVQILLTIPVLG